MTNDTTMDRPNLTLLERFGMARDGHLDAEQDEYTPDGEYRAFGVLRQNIGAAATIDFISRQGNHQSFAYTHLYQTTFDPSNAIELYFTEHTVAIRGHRLHELYRRLLTHRVTFVCEADSASAQLQRDQPVVVACVIAPRQVEL